MRAILGIISLILAVPASAADSPEGVEFFEKKIRPVLVEHCYSCHSIQAKKQRGGLLLDSRDSLRKGGDTGTGLVPGKPNESLLIKAVRHHDDALKMPPKGKLPDAVISDFERWVTMGAPDPRDKVSTPAGATWDEILKARRDWWSLKPVQRKTGMSIDALLDVKRDAAGLKAAGEADRGTLLRRLSLVITGLPPTPAEIEESRRDTSPDWYEKQVERLLASPHFGERWGRHWLDVVRFTETHGNEWNYEVHHAWRYRDYLTRAFNDDVPYDQFVKEHIAGDLLPRPRRNREARFNESVIGTAFYRFGEVNHDDCIDLRQIGYDLLDNQIDTLGKAFQGTTIACARCHDHKIDAVSMKDYYGLLGILRGSRLVSHAIDSPETDADIIRRLHELKKDIRAEIGAAWNREAQTLTRRKLDEKKEDKKTLEDPIHIWKTIAGAKDFDKAWAALSEQMQREQTLRKEFNAKNFTTFADFRTGTPTDWQAGGQGTRHGSSKNGEFVVAVEGDKALKAILPAGCYTHSLSDRLNGTLRSPVLPKKVKRISFQVMGQRSSALRLVSNHCQLNYKNYKALTNDTLQWISFEPPPDADVLRTYAELMTMLDNPKFPDQLSALGGDPQNYRLPWEKAAENPRSFFGIVRVVLHDTAETPREELGHLLPLFAGPPPRSLDDVAARLASMAKTAVENWTADRATEDDVRLLRFFMTHGLLGNSIRQTPQVEKLIGEYRTLEGKLSLPRVIPGIADHGSPVEQPIFTRGDCLRPGDVAPRRYLEVLSKSGEKFEPSGSGRLDLALRIASADNPLTARVMVNRVWHHLFGTGIVRTVDDFGRVGEPPSHPELLDHLAGRFVEDGWSVKQLIRSIVLTRAFRMESRPPEGAGTIDPQNRLLSHYPARRMEAEAIRDSILAASGRLDRTLYGMSVQPWREKENADRRLFPGPLDGNGRRSVYIKNNLMEGPQFLGAFNFPDGKTAHGRRDVTNVPAQALALLNDPFVHQQADVWSERLVKRIDATIGERIEHLFRTALGRMPSVEESRRFEQAVLQFAELHRVKEADLMKSRAVWKDVAHAAFNLKEFIYIR